MSDHFAAANLIRGNKLRVLCVLTIQDGGTIMEELKKYDKGVATTAEKALLKTSWGFESVLLEII